MPGLMPGVSGATNFTAQCPCGSEGMGTFLPFPAVTMGTRTGILAPPFVDASYIGGGARHRVLNFLRHLSLQQLHGAAIPLRHIHRDIASRVVPGPTVWSRALRLPQRYAVLNVELRAPAEVLIPPPA
eukprot:COSAG06_NODE_137_length_22365_cov_49.346313_19_plen_128_part_00